MSDTLYSRVLAVLRASGPQGIRTDALAHATGCKPLVLNNYIKRHRADGVEIHTHWGIQAPATLYAKREWYEAAKAARALESAAKVKAREQKRSQAKSELVAVRRAKAQAEAAAKRAIVSPKVVAVALRRASSEPCRPLPHVGELPPANVLPHQPVYSRHQIAALPPGFVSALNPRECRPWALAVVAA